MKKLILFLLFALPILGMAQNDKGTWDYPVKPGSKEWKSFQSSDEMVSACQIPNYVLKNASTSDLLELCLKYPMFFDIHFAINLQDGLDVIISSFNGLTEFYNRRDCGKVLIDKYSKEQPCDVQLIKNNNSQRLFYLELMISQHQVLANLDEAQRRWLLKESLNKINDKIDKKYSLFYELSTALIISRLLGSFESVGEVAPGSLLYTFRNRGTLIDSSLISKIVHDSQKYLKK